ncbi:hypothetical protein BMF94_4011 [Rhodotorula taiwanensis]|uniref:Uncharacterized protein n=1 Tax=Rhodotorula taiwanensis TaxID=741276 RepID=A0A2S5B848_9BASI|nr:hypothetical protein BMF94_4011 [Rhodotorula taiwanensis]
MHSPDHDGPEELKACHQQLAEALAQPAVREDWTKWFVQEIVHSGRFRINGGASEETAEAMAGAFRNTLTWIEGSLLPRIDGVLRRHHA